MRHARPAGIPVGVALAAVALQPCAAAATPPNIVVIYADDLGYGDLHCYNPDRGKIATPHLDRLAGEGMRFTDAHSSSGVCSPSRYTLLTGRYHWRTRKQAGIVGMWGDPLIAPDRMTLGTLAQKHGYRTACIGKWHLGWNWSLTPEEKRAVASPQPAAGSIPTATVVVGDLLAALDAAGAAPHTLVVFSSDNGFASYVGAKDLESRGHRPSGPLRGYKSDAWEGGHRVPFIVRWPGVVQPGTVCHQLVHQADLMRTCAEILGTVLPDTCGEDSFSLIPLLKGGTGPVREHAVSCSARGVPAVRLGSWKYIAGPGAGGLSSGSDASQGVQLYDLAADIGERNNIAEAQPDRIVAMQQLLERLIADGRSTMGAPQKNDVDVIRHPRP